MRERRAHDRRTFAPATIYDAHASPGCPLVVYGESTHKHPEGLSVIMFFSGKGRLKGVEVYDGDLDKTVAKVGKVKP